MIWVLVKYILIYYVSIIRKIENEYCFSLDFFFDVVS